MALGRSRSSLLWSFQQGRGGGGAHLAITVTANIDMHSAQPIEREADPLLDRGERVCLCVCVRAPPQAISSAYQRDVWGETH